MATRILQPYVRNGAAASETNPVAGAHHGSHSSELGRQGELQGDHFYFQVYITCNCIVCSNIRHKSKIILSLNLKKSLRLSLHTQPKTNKKQETKQTNKNNKK